MKTIWKFPLFVIDEQSLEMPKGAELLTIQPQHDGVCLWALCDPHAAKERRVIVIVGTGHQHPDESFARLRYVSTFQFKDGYLVFHAFELK